MRVAAQGSLVLFVGTKRQTAASLEELASKCGMPFCTEAFEHVAHSFTTTLPRLLKECRRRGLPDEEAKNALVELENVYRDDDRQLSAQRSAAGEAFIYRNNGASSYVASMNELFMELEPADVAMSANNAHTKKSEVANLPPPIKDEAKACDEADEAIGTSGKHSDSAARRYFSIVQTLRATGLALSDAEAVVLTAARNLNPKFMKGRPVNAYTVARIARSYHGGKLQDASIESVLTGLSERGIILRDRKEFQLAAKLKAGRRRRLRIRPDQG